MATTEVLVTGGTGALGRRVVERLGVEDVEAQVLSRTAGTVRGDLLTGEGLEKAVAGIDTIVHCASSPFRKARQVDVEGTGRLLDAAARAGVSHFVYISIVGIEHVTSYPYYRIKLDTERVVERSPVPYTILRATQFHSFVLRVIQYLERLPVMVVPRGFLGQPIDIREVAELLVELALSRPAGRVPDIAGPEIWTLADAIHSYFRVTGRPRRFLEVPIPGKTARAIRDGALTCSEAKYGKVRWEEFLHQM